MDPATTDHLKIYLLNSQGLNDDDYKQAKSIAHAVSHADYEMARDLRAVAILTPTQSVVSRV